MKKWICTILVVILSVSVLAGCGEKISDKDEQGRTILNVGNWPSSEKKLAVYESRKERFEEANPDVVVERNEWAFNLKTFYAKAAGGQLPTVYPSPFTEVSQIMNAGYSSSITDVLEERGYEGKFNEKILELVTDEKGNIIAFPYESYVLGLAFNTDLMAKAGLMEEDGTPKQPKDWNEVAEFAVKIKEATGKAGFVFPTSNRSGGWIFTSLAWSFGVDFMEQNEDGKWIATFDSPECAEALQFIKDLKWKYDVLPSNTLIDGTEWYKLFATENAAMMITAGDYPQRVVQYGMTPDRIGMMAMPAGPKRHVTLLGGMVYNVSQTATKDQIDAAVRWIETESSFVATEDFKKTTMEKIQNKLDVNQHVGIKMFSPWSLNAESLAYEHKMIEKNVNANINHVRLYNEFVENCPADIQPEEPMCAQDLYGILDSCLQEVLTNENADCAALVKKANSDFQVNYLNNL